MQKNWRKALLLLDVVVLVVGFAVFVVLLWLVMGWAVMCQW